MFQRNGKCQNKEINRIFKIKQSWKLIVQANHLDVGLFGLNYVLSFHKISESLIILFLHKDKYFKMYLYGTEYLLHNRINTIMFPQFFSVDDCLY